MQEPIKHFYNITGFDRSQIMKYALGGKFIGLMLRDGKIGICSTLGTEVDDAIIRKEIKPDLDNPGHRIILNAYFNAVHNYSNRYEKHSDIFDAIDFGKLRDIVMIGYFESLYEKFRSRNIPVKAYDRSVENRNVEPLAEMNDSLLKAGVVIVTGTTLFNKSIMEILEATPDNCNVLLLGPSNILHNDMLKYRNVKMVFGSVFDNFDDSIIRQVGEGLGARQFLKVENKVFINSDHFSFS